MNSYLEIFFWTVTIYIITIAVVHFIKVFRKGRRENSTDLTKAIIYLASGLTLAMLLLYKPFGESIVKIAGKLAKRPVGAELTDAVIITTTTTGAATVSV